jgi:hypothetical protein
MGRHVALRQSGDHSFQGLGEFGPVLDPELLVGGMELVLDGAVGQEQAGRDLLVRETGGGKAGDLQLPGSENGPSGDGSPMSQYATPASVPTSAIAII